MNAIVMRLPALVLLLPFFVNAAPLMYVPTGGTNEVLIIDLKTDTITGRIPELENAHGLAASPDGEYLVAGSMKPLDAGVSNEASKPAAVSEAEHASHHGGGAEQGAAGHSYVSIIHPAHGHVMRRIAVRGLTHHTAVSPDGNYAIAVHSGAGGISVIDLKRMAVVKEIQTGRSPNYALFGNKGDRLFVSNALSGTVSEIDTHNWNTKREIAVGKEPEHMALAPDGKTLFVANVGEGQAVAVDIRSGSVSKRYTIGPQPHGIGISDDGRWLFATSKGGGKLVRIDLNNGDQRAIDLQPAPYHLEHVGTVGKLYVSSSKESKIWVIDPQTLKVRGDIAIGKGVAHQMVVVDW